MTYGDIGNVNTDEEEGENSKMRSRTPIPFVFHFLWTSVLGESIFRTYCKVTPPATNRLFGVVWNDP